MTGEVVPFGKYRGQPVEVLAQDRPYLDWLSGQAWFRERHAGIYTLIVNNFAEPTETPEHNALQVLFLEDSYCSQLFSVIEPDWYARAINELPESATKRRERLVEASHDGAKEAEENVAHDFLFERYTKQVDDCAAALKRYPTHFTWRIREWQKHFEIDGIDVRLRHSGIQTVEQFPDWYDGRIVEGPLCSGGGALLHIEIKPTVGDDYPAVLRQMRAQRREHSYSTDILFTERYTGTGATEAQFVQTFALSQIRVIFRHQVESQPKAPSEGHADLPG